ncbi:MAG: NUDIX hydrolase, partial [Faecalibacillus sp.]
MKQTIEQYQPYNEQEEKDKAILLKVYEEKDVLTRKNQIGHFTASAWVVNHDRTKVLMCYHHIYNSWSWLGGHVDGNDDFKSVALKEVKEESGLHHLQLLDNSIFSLEILTVDGHIKNNEYVSSHLHYNLTYLIEANEDEQLTINKDENSDLKWFTLDEALRASSEPWFV